MNLGGDSTTHQQVAIAKGRERLMRRVGLTPTLSDALAMAVEHAQKPWIVPITGTRKLERLEENIGAAEMAITPDELSQIDRALSKITVQGARYPEKLEQMTGR
jgi:aryl-alcohol dehydrogenase-like predicted oxidoreductase